MVITGGTKRRISGGGSPFFDKHKIINQITGDFTERKEKYGAGQFGNLPKSESTDFVESMFCFDGVGVRVSASGEPDLTA